MKLCKDCVFFDAQKSFSNFWQGSVFPRCGNPNALYGAQTLVAGKPSAFADLEREYGPCGRDGKNWVAK